jgi:NhaP-type Na+/H+ or K+/H+ antiporter
MTEAIDGYGFLAVFLAGLAFRRYERDHEINARVHTSSEVVEKFLELAVILALGSLLSTAGLSAPGWAGWLLAGVLLVAIRPLACAAALAGSKVQRTGERAFVGWFGVRGVGTLYYAALVVTSGALASGEERVLVWTVVACVLVSISVHGITAGPSMRRVMRPYREATEAPGDGRVRPRPARVPATPRAR